MVYVKAYYDWIEQTKALSDAEKGRLFISILEYARSGLIPKSEGRESLLFPVFQSQVDRDRKSSEASAENGRKGGRPKTKDNLDKPNLTKGNLAKGNKDKDKDKDKEEDKDKEVFEVLLSPFPEVDEAIHEFIAYRKKTKRAMTDEAINLLVKKLNKLSTDPNEQVEILHQSIVNGWTGIFELHTDKKSSKQEEANKVLREWVESYEHE